MKRLEAPLKNPHSLCAALAMFINEQNGRYVLACSGGRDTALYIPLPEMYAGCTKRLDPLNLSSLVTVSVALSRPRVAKAKPDRKSYECKASRFVWKFFDGKRARGTEGRVALDIIYGKRREGRYGMAVHERFDPTRRAMDGREHTGAAPLWAPARAGQERSRPRQSPFREPRTAGGGAAATGAGREGRARIGRDNLPANFI
jgi:hypothetical protein